MEENKLDTTIDEWRAELERLGSRNDPGYTAAELAKELGISVRTMREYIAKSITEGKCIQGSATRKDQTGRNYHVSVYQLTPEKRNNKK